jgi:tight adherence protein B
MPLWAILLCVFAAVAAAGYGLALLLFASGGYEDWALQSLRRRLALVPGFLPPERLLQASFLIALGLFVLGLALAGRHLLGGLLLGFILGSLGLLFPHLAAAYLARKRLDRLNAELPGALEILSSSLRAGLTLHQAIERNLPRLPPTLADEFQILLGECRLGASMTDAMRRWAERVGLLDVKLTVIASELSLRHGGNLAESYLRLSQTIRERYLFNQQVQALTAEGRLQALVMTILPFVILVVMTLVRRDEMLEFLGSPLGLGSVLSVFLMQVAAYFWIRKVMEIET